MSNSSTTGPCVVITHRIQPGKDEEFLQALRRLQAVRRDKGWVTERWLVLKNRDVPDTYTQIVEYVSPEAETTANEAPEIAEARREVGRSSAGYPDHVWTTVVSSTP